MEFELFLNILGFFLFILLISYLYFNKKIIINKDTDNIVYKDNYQNINEQNNIVKDNKVDWSITQHIGWLYKNGISDFNNLNLYFNTSDASFFALPINNNDKIILNVNSEEIKNNNTIQINNTNYKIIFIEN